MDLYSTNSLMELQSGGNLSYRALKRRVAQVSVKDGAAPAHNTAPSSCHSQL